MRYAGAGEGIFPIMPLHYVDPNKKRGPLYRATVRIGRTRLGGGPHRASYRLANRPEVVPHPGGRYPASSACGPQRTAHDHRCQDGSAARGANSPTSTMDPIQY